MTALKAINNSIRSEPQLALIRQMLATHEPFFTLKGTVTARNIQAFLLVAQKEGLSVSEYGKQAGISLSTMSRILLDLGERDRNFDEGLGLIEGFENPENRREKLYRLTYKGRALLARVSQRGGVK